MVVCIRWVDEDFMVHEDPVELIHLLRTDASTITSALKDCLLRFCLPLEQCRGQACFLTLLKQEKRSYLLVKFQSARWRMCILSVMFWIKICLWMGKCFLKSSICWRFFTQYLLQQLQQREASQHWDGWKPFWGLQCLRRDLTTPCYCMFTKAELIQLMLWT